MIDISAVVFPWLHKMYRKGSEKDLQENRKCCHLQINCHLQGIYKSQEQPPQNTLKLLQSQYIYVFQYSMLVIFLIAHLALLTMVQDSSNLYRNQHLTTQLKNESFLADKFTGFWFKNYFGTKCLYITTSKCMSLL